MVVYPCVTSPSPSPCRTVCLAKHSLTQEDQPFFFVLLPFNLQIPPARTEDAVLESVTPLTSSTLPTTVRQRSRHGAGPPCGDSAPAPQGYNTMREEAERSEEREGKRERERERERESKPLPDLTGRKRKANQARLIHRRLLGCCIYQGICSPERTANPLRVSCFGSFMVCVLDLM